MQINIVLETQLSLLLFVMCFASQKWKFTSWHILKYTQVEVCVTDNHAIFLIFYDSLNSVN